MRILLIEDDAEISAYVEMELRHEGYAVSAAYDGVSGLQAALDADFDVILLDMMLPGLNGLEVLRRLRAQKQTPVIVVTARDTVMDKVTGLDAGANDYITKPFHVEELLTRSARGESASLLKNGDIELDRKKRLVTRGGSNITLTKTQFDLLEYFLLNLDIVLLREQLLSAVWGYSYAGDSNVVDDTCAMCATAWARQATAN